MIGLADCMSWFASVQESGGKGVSGKGGGGG